MKALIIFGQGLDDLAEVIAGVCNFVLVTFHKVLAGRSQIITQGLTFAGG
jgi:hypothetical protein